MADVFRIQERFEMVGRRVVYTVKIPPGAAIRRGDILLDLRGNHFKVQGAEEMPGRIPYGNFADMPTGVVLEATDGVQVSGTILVRELFYRGLTELGLRSRGEGTEKTSGNL